MRKISKMLLDTSLLSVAARLESGRTRKPASKPQKALIVLLKSSRFVSDDVISRGASALGIMQSYTMRAMIMAP